jgi:hypothetical protein
MTTPKDDKTPASPSAFAFVSELGPSAQAAIPGVYAWAVTVAPAAWARGAPLLPKVVAVFGLGMLGAAAILERRSGVTRADQLARVCSVWGLVLSAALVWALSPAALSPFRMESARGVAGMIGWALFAFASAGPSLKRDPAEAERATLAASLKPRAKIPRGDRLYLVGGILGAIAIQLVGWKVTVPERAVLVRLVTLAAGLGILGGATSVGLARHQPRAPLSRRKRTRRALPSLVMLAIVGAVGLMLAILQR